MWTKWGTTSARSSVSSYTIFIFFLDRIDGIFEWVGLTTPGSEMSVTCMPRMARGQSESICTQLYPYRKVALTEGMYIRVEFSSVLYGSEVRTGCILTLDALIIMINAWQSQWLETKSAHQPGRIHRRNVKCWHAPKLLKCGLILGKFMPTNAPLTWPQVKHTCQQKHTTRATVSRPVPQEGMQLIA